MMGLYCMKKIDNYLQAVSQLETAVTAYQSNSNDALYRDGLIQRFEFSTELAWKSLKDYLEDQGLSISMASPRAVLKEAYASGIVDDETVWNEILQARNLTSHIYDEKTAITIADQICHHFMAAFRKLKSFYKHQAE